MMGRYGVDKMSQVLSGCSLALVAIGIIFKISVCYWAGFVLIGVIYFRMLSRNIPKRYAENQAFLRYYYRLTGWFTGKKQSLERNKGYHIYRCPQCKQKVRVPKGKGKISIHCPKCSTDFIKRS
jgi:DNA-directed RNA polymerase subunit RPC12/RpoP